MSYEDARGFMYLVVAGGGVLWIMGSNIARTYSETRERLRRMNAGEDQRYDLLPVWHRFVDTLLSMLAAAAWVLAITWIYTPEGA